jgi:hypothetical protein
LGSNFAVLRKFSVSRAERLVSSTQFTAPNFRNQPVGARQNSRKQASKNESQQWSGSQANSAAHADSHERLFLGSQVQRLSFRLELLLPSGLTAKCLILISIPGKCVLKMLGIKIWPILVSHVEIRINRLHGEKTAQSASPNWPNMSDQTWAKDINAYYGTTPPAVETV